MVRSVSNPLCHDSAITYTRDNCIIEVFSGGFVDLELERVCPDFTKWNEVTSFSHIQEAVVEYAALISNNFKASNINLLKGSYSIARCVIQHCGAGPRACSKVIDFCVLKIHDKKIGSELSSLLLDIAGKIGPNAVIDAVILRE